MHTYIVRMEQKGKDEARTVPCTVTQRYLKTFIEECLGAIQVFNYSVPSSAVAYSQPTFSRLQRWKEPRKRPFPFFRSFARRRFSLAPVCTHASGRVDSSILSDSRRQFSSVLAVARARVKRFATVYVMRTYAYLLGISPTVRTALYIRMHATQQQRESGAPQLRLRFDYSQFTWALYTGISESRSYNWKTLIQFERARAPPGNFCETSFPTASRWHAWNAFSSISTLDRL